MRSSTIALALCASLAATQAAAENDQLNISQFVFRDLNRNGVYDVGEAPFAGIPVAFLPAEGAPATRFSNLAGFANFVMSAGDPEVPVNAPGPAEVRIVVPPGLELTTGNPVQRTTVLDLPGSPAGVVIDPPLPFVGIAPTLTIESSGTLATSMRCVQGEVSAEARLDTLTGTLICDAAPGDWEVTWTLADGSEATRTVSVGAWPVRAAVPQIDRAEPAPDDIVLGFEDILVSENIEEMASGHGGVGWHNWVATHRKFYGGRGYVNTAEGQFVIYNSSGHPARMFSDAPFDFIGARVGVAWEGALGFPVRFEALRDGEVVAWDEFYASQLRPLEFDAGWAGIDEVRTTHGGYWQVVLDDVRFGG